MKPFSVLISSLHIWNATEENIWLKLMPFFLGIFFYYKFSLFTLNIFAHFIFIIEYNSTTYNIFTFRRSFNYITMLFFKSAYTLDILYFLIVLILIYTNFNWKVGIYEWNYKNKKFLSITLLKFIAFIFIAEIKFKIWY